MVIQMEDCGGGNVYDKWMQNDMDLSEDEIWKLLEHITKVTQRSIDCYSKLPPPTDWR
jgi:hypothetical protein